ncbi:unnamed protein product [Rotaria magnacalcarata]|uniref:Uncharacterized protein n=1 Tax=Rotaria magnacalcarata TaxID=392030 RepID=A0A816YLR1_9BILA|nr:unnamed protein product [Rotaria magnacalcarata]CAF3982254.1 unnamed protein product [Rotaria magnacalcarata]
MPDVFYDDNKLVMLLRRFRQLNVHYNISVDGRTIVILCSRSNLSRENIIQILRDEEIPFHLEDADDTIIIQVVTLLGRKISDDTPFPKHLVEATRLVRYWKHINNKCFRMHECNLHNPELETMTLQEQIRNMIESTGFDSNDAINEIIAYENIPPLCNIQEAEEVVD